MGGGFYGGLCEIEILKVGKYLGFFGFWRVNILFLVVGNIVLIFFVIFLLMFIFFNFFLENVVNDEKYFWDFFLLLYELDDFGELVFFFCMWNWENGI